MTEFINGKPLLYWCGCLRGREAAALISEIALMRVRYVRIGRSAHGTYHDMLNGPRLKVGGKGRDRYVLFYKPVIRISLSTAAPPPPPSPAG